MKKGVNESIEQLRKVATENKSAMIAFFDDGESISMTLIGQKLDVISSFATWMDEDEDFADVVETAVMARKAMKADTDGTLLKMAKAMDQAFKENLKSQGDA